MKTITRILLSLSLMTINCGSALAATWQASGATNAGIIPIVQKANTGATYYAAAFGGGLFKSSDNGKDWQPVGVTGLKDLNSVQVVALDDQTLFTVTTSGTYRSDDAGNNWSRINIAGSNILDASMLKLENIKAGYQYAVYPSIHHVLSVLDSQHIFLITKGNDIVTSSDGGKTWVNIVINDQYIQHTVTDIFALTPQCLIIALQSGGVYQSTDGGQHWAGFNIQGYAGYGFEDFNVIDPSNFLAVSIREIGGFDAPVDIYKTTNAGKIWMIINNGLPASLPHAKIFAANTSRYFVTSYDSLYETIDGGKSWAKVPTDFQHEIIMSANTNADGAIVATTNGNGIFISSDHGKSWQQANHLSAGYISAIYAKSKQDIYLGIQGAGLSISHDGGTTWHLQTSGLTNLNVNAVITNDGKTIVAATDDGVFKSDDGGATFSKFGTGISGVWNPVHVLSLLQTENGTYLAGTDNGLYRLDGDKWTNILSPFAVPSITNFNHRITITLGMRSYTGSLKAFFEYSDNQGASWTPSTVPGIVAQYNYYADPVIFQVSPEVQYAADELNVYLYDSRVSKSWAVISAGKLFPLQGLNHLVVQGNTVFVATNYRAIEDINNETYVHTIGVQTTNDNGKTWLDGNDGLRSQGISKLSVLDDTVYAGTQGSDLFVRSN